MTDVYERRQLWKDILEKDLEKEKIHKFKKIGMGGIKEAPLSSEEISNNIDSESDESLSPMQRKFRELYSNADMAKLVSVSLSPDSKTFEEAAREVGLTDEEIEVEFDRIDSLMQFELPREKEKDPVYRVDRTFDGRYQDIKVATEQNKEAGTRNCFLAKIGDREVFIKEDKKKEDIANENARKNVEKGCNTKRAATISYKFDIEEALKNNVSPIVDHDKKYVYSVEPFFKDSESLRRHVIRTVKDKETNKEREEIHPLNFKDFKKVFSDMLTAEGYLLSNNVLHRDPNSRNVLVRRNVKGDLETRVVDFANACEGKEVKGGPLQTMGSRDIADPLAFNGQVRYDEQSETYALAANMIFALTGEYATRYDFLENPNVDPNEHKAAIENALKKFPKRAKKLKKIIRKATSMDPKKRYDSFTDFHKAFNKACKTTLWEEVKANWGKMATITTLIGSLIGASVYSGAVNSRNQSLEAKVSQGKYIEVETDHNGSKMQIENNLFSLDYRIKSKEGYKNIIQGEEGSKYIQVKPGQEVEIDPKLTPLPLPSNISDLRWVDTLRGRAFLEDVVGSEKLFIPRMDFNDMTDIEDDAWAIGCWYDTFDFAIPSNLPEGNYMLNLEIWGENPDSEYTIKDREERRQNGSDIVHYNENQMIARTKIPVTVGNPEALISPRTERVRILNDLRVDLYGTNEMFGAIKDLSYEAYLIDDKGKRKLDVSLSGCMNADYVTVSLPKGMGKGYKCQVELIPKLEDKVMGRFTFPAESVGNEIYEISTDSNRPRDN